MSGFDQMLREWAAREGSPVPEGFDGRIRAALEGLPEERQLNRQMRPLRTAVVAAALCGICAVTALALSPGLREGLNQALGSFAPYSQRVDDVSVEDQGIQVRVVSALADESGGTAYLEITDLTGDRLDESTALNDLGAACIAYDPEVRTALVAQRLSPQTRNGDGTATVSIDRILTGVVEFQDVTVPWELFTGQELKSVRLAEDQVDRALSSVRSEDGYLVLEPDQTPAELDTELFSLSSMGFDSEGIFHVQFALAEGVELADLTQFYAWTVENDWGAGYCNEHLVLFEGRYLDVRYEAFTQAHFGHFRVDGWMGVLTKPAIEGEWTLTFPLEILPERTVYGQWDGLYNMDEVEFHLTAMSLRLDAVYEDPDRGGFFSPVGSSPAYVFCRDGSVMALELEDWTKTYQNPDSSIAGLGEILPDRPQEGSRLYGACYRWSFLRAVDPAEITAVSIGKWYVPLEGEAAGPGNWLEELPE